MIPTSRTAQLLVLSLVSAFAAAGNHNADSAALASNPIYKKNCAKCHGKTAEGRHFGGPSLISEKAAAASTDDLRNIVTNGKGRMPKFTDKLAVTDIDELVQQIKAANKK